MTREDTSGKEQVSYRVRWREPDGRQRARTFGRRRDAERHRDNIAADLVRGQYLDPDAGRITLKQYGDEWLAAQTFDRSTWHATELRLRLHVYPVLGSKRLDQIKPSTIQAWLRGMTVKSSSYRRTIYANVSAILSAAVDDGRLVKNPCSARSVRPPKVDPRKVVPWPADRVEAVREALPERFKVAVTLAAGLGLRQGEVFGLSPDDVDFLRGEVEVRRQVKLFPSNRQAFALPKGRKTRTVPLPATVRDTLAAYLASRPGRAVTLPWETVDGEQTTVNLVLWTRESTALNRNYFNTHVWHSALATAKVATARENGMHALRHYYASVLLDSGVSIKAVSEYLGHADPGFTLRTYTHLMPESSERARSAVDAALSRVQGVYSKGDGGASSQVSGS